MPRSFLPKTRIAPRAAVAGNECTRVRSSSDSLISHNSRSARSASASSKGRSCRHCSDRRKSQAGRNSASRHRTRNNLGLDRYTKGAGCGAPCAKPKLSGRKLEGCYSVAADSPAGSRSRASVVPAVYGAVQPAQRPAAAIGRQQSTETRGAASAHHRRPAVGRRFKSECTLQRNCFQLACETIASREKQSLAQRRTRCRWSVAVSGFSRLTHTGTVPIWDTRTG